MVVVSNQTQKDRQQLLTAKSPSAASSIVKLQLK